MQPTFKIADDSDVEILLKFMRQFYAEDGYLFADSLARRALTELLRDSSLGRVWLIVLDDLAVGYMVLALGYSLEYHGPRCAYR